MSVISLMGRGRTATANTTGRIAEVIYRQAAQFSGRPIELVIVSQRERNVGYFVCVRVKGEQGIHLMHGVGATPVVAYRALLILSLVLRRGLAPAMNLDEELVDRCLTAADANLNPNDAVAQAAIDWAVAWVTVQQYYWIRSLRLPDLPDGIRIFYRADRSARPRSHRA